MLNVISRDLPSHHMVGWAATKALKSPGGQAWGRNFKTEGPECAILLNSPKIGISSKLDREGYLVSLALL
jgi:hypothetical protein